MGPFATLLRHSGSSKDRANLTMQMPPEFQQSVRSECYLRRFRGQSRSRIRRVPHRIVNREARGRAAGFNAISIDVDRRSEGRGRDRKVAHHAAARDARRRDLDHGLDHGHCSLSLLQQPSLSKLRRRICNPSLALCSLETFSWVSTRPQNGRCVCRDRPRSGVGTGLPRNLI
jgi:hypothetical protein